MVQLKKYRNEKAWTQRQVAENVGITVRQYQYIEAGTKKPSYSVLCKLEKMFGLTHQELLAQNDE